MAIAVNVTCPKCKRTWTKLGYVEDHGKEYICRDCDGNAANDELQKVRGEHANDPSRTRA